MRPNGALRVFGQTAMFFCRLVLEVPTTYFGLRDVRDLSTTYIVSAIFLLLLHLACQ